MSTEDLYANVVFAHAFGGGLGLRARTRVAQPYADTSLREFLSHDGANAFSAGYAGDGGCKIHRWARLVWAGKAASPADVGRQTSVVITMLPDTPDVELVLSGPDGVLSALQPGSVVIDMSSISPVATRRLAQQVAERGGTMLDAPVSGGEIGAIN